jgi:hypothetical protein
MIARRPWPPPAARPDQARQAARAYGQCAADDSVAWPTVAEVVRVGRSAKIRVTAPGKPDRLFDSPAELERAGIDLATLQLRGMNDAFADSTR